MRLRLLTDLVVTDCFEMFRVIPRGETREWDDAEAARLIAAGVAEAADFGYPATLATPTPPPAPPAETNKPRKGEKQR